MEYTTEDIIRYVEGDMEPQEQQQFVSDMENNSFLQKRVDEVKQILSSLRMDMHTDRSKAELTETLSGMNEKYFRKQSKVVSMKAVWWRAIPAAAAAIIITFLLLPGKSNLYDQYNFIEMPGSVERNDKADSLLVLAEESYNSKEFETARNYLQQLYHQSNENSLVAFYYGVSLMQVDSTQKSRTVLEEINNGQSIYKQEAAFYIGLSYLKEKNNAAAIEWLERIPKDSGPGKKAEEILKKIK